MNGSPELLEFYLVEATEYLDALDHVVANTGGPPDGNAFIATARALRGASSMAKVEPVAAIATTMEQLAHAVRDGELRWTMDLYQTLRDSVDDLRFLVRGVRTWGEREGARAAARLASLQRFLPSEQPRPATPAASATAPVFIALQASAIAAELDAFLDDPRQRRALDEALTRARTMRGIAGIGEYPPLADVAEALDRAVRTLVPDAPLADREVELFRAAVEVLRHVSAQLRDAGGAPAEAPEVARFARAFAALDALLPPAEPVVSIDELFYADAGPHVVRRAQAAPASRMQRFRDEITTRAEHIRRLVNDARQVHDLAGRERAGRALTGALLDLQGVAASFDAHQVASFFGEAAAERALLDPALLDALDAGTLLLLSPGESLGEIEQRLAVLERVRRHTPVSPPVVSPSVSPASPPPAPVTASASPAPAPVTASASPAPAVAPAPPTADVAPAAPAAAVAPTPFGAPVSGPHAALSRRPPPTPTGRELQDFLQEGIAGFESLDHEPLSTPARLDEDEIVPIESLLYRGQDAVRRAIEVRDAMRARGVTDDATLQEIFDLLDLAQAE